MQVARSIGARFNLVTSEIYETDKVAHTVTQYSWRSEHSPEAARAQPGKSCALTCPTQVNSLITHALPQIGIRPPTQDKPIFLQVVLNVLD